MSLFSVMVTALQTDFSASSPMRRSVYAGLYLFIAGLLLSLLLSDMLSVLADVIPLPVTYSVVVFACPTVVFGAGTWWAVVERGGAHSYRHGAIVGVATALLTGLVWTTLFVAVWGVEMVTVPIVAFLVVFVLGIAVVVGGLAGLPLMYACRRLNRS